jgi:actin, other eukaryote
LFGYDSIDAKIADPSILLKYLKPGDFKNKIDLEFCDFIKDIFETRLNKSPADYKVIVNVQPNKNFDNLSGMTKLFLDDLGFKAVSIMNSASLALFSTGRTSGLVVDCGEIRSYITPIYEGFPLYHAFNKNKIGGRDLTEIIANGIRENNISVHPEDLRSLRLIKEKTLSIPYLHNYNYYMETANDIIPPEKMLYKLPDETIINIPKKYRLMASEVLFK